MYLPRLCTALLLVSTCLVLAGCPATNRTFIQIPQGSGLISEGKAGKESETSQARIAAKRADRQLSLSRYYNPDYGVSFHYPRYYLLEEGEILEHSYFLKRQEELGREEHGAQLIATVLIPDDSYPNTTFVHGSVQLVIDRNTSEAGCFDTVSPTPGDERTIRVLSLVGGLQFLGSERSSATAGTQILERDYATFENKACYEFYLVVAVNEPAPDDELKPADSQKIMHQLEKIASSLKFGAQSLAPDSFQHAENDPRLESQARFIPVRQ